MTPADRADGGPIGDPDDGSDDSVVLPDDCPHPAVQESCQNGWCTIPPGCFVMGSPRSEPCRETPVTTDVIPPNTPHKETQHVVRLTHGFIMAATEVTELQFQQLVNYPNTHSCGADCPININYALWDRAAAYCNALSAKEQLPSCYSCTGSDSQFPNCIEAAGYVGQKIYDCPGYRLPTEAEWEYAYRAGTRTALYTGDVGSCTGTSPNAGKIARYSAVDDGVCQSTGCAGPVGQKAANGWGLHDLAGNAWEFVHDYLQNDLGSAAVTDPVMALRTAEGRAIRGGDACSSPRLLRAAQRASQKDFSFSALSFRCVRTIAP